MTTMIQKQTGSLHARIPQAVLEEIDRIAATMDRSRNWIFTEALKQYVELQQWQTELIKERVKESKSSRAKFISHTEIMNRQEKRLKAKLRV